MPTLIDGDQIASRLGYALSRDVDFAAALALIFGAAARCTVQVGNDARRDPGTWDVPAVVIIPHSDDSGSEAPTYTFRLDVELRIKDDREERLPGGSSAVPLLEHVGVYRLAEFRRAVLASWRRTLLSTALHDLDVVRHRRETEAMYPLMGALLEISVTVPGPLSGAVVTLASHRTPVDLVADLAALTVAPDGTADLQLRIDTDPYTDVTLAAAISGNAGLSITAGATRVYAGSAGGSPTWSTYQTVTIAAASDATGAGTLSLSRAAGTNPVAPLAIPITISA